MKQLTSGLELAVKIVLYPIGFLFCLVALYGIWIEWIWPILALLGALLGFLWMVALVVLASGLIVVAVASVIL